MERGNKYKSDSNASELKDYRPASIYSYVVSNSPKFIGWDDDKFRNLLEQYRAKLERENAKLPPDKKIESVEVTGFRLGSLVAGAAKDFVYSRTDPQLDDLKSDLKKLENRNKKAGEASNQSGINIRGMKLYQNVLSTLKFQRDVYIMGEDFADKNSKKRNSFLPGDDKPSRIAKPMHVYKDFIPPSPKVGADSLANKQLIDIATWFIPSKTMYDSLRPTILWTISQPNSSQPDGGVLRHQFHRSVIDLIPLSQPLLDSSLKSTIKWFLKDDTMKMSVKGSSLSYLGGAQNHDSNTVPEQTGGRVVATKTVFVKT